eukprot:COSAG02_NODE_1440_length_12590_cov_2.822352_4_plen_397_part_00
MCRFSGKVAVQRAALTRGRVVPGCSGKVRAVYWLTPGDSARLIAERGYDVAPASELAVMVISDRISAYEIIWRGEGGMSGCPGKGAALNAISNHWFKLFKERGLASSHILEVPHPLVWIVQRAQPVMIEAICRQYITGSMWRDYAKGNRAFCGIDLPDGLEKDQRLPELLVTPSTKGILKGIPGVPEQDDVNVSRSDIQSNHEAFGFASPADIDVYERLLKEGFGVISEALSSLDQIFVDTKFEFGYAKDAKGQRKLIYMDEVGTPDSSRIWDGPAYRNDGETDPTHRKRTGVPIYRSSHVCVLSIGYLAGKVIEKSKEEFRQMLLKHFPDPDILLDKKRMQVSNALQRFFGRQRAASESLTTLPLVSLWYGRNALRLASKTNCRRASWRPSQRRT